MEMEKRMFDNKANYGDLCGFAADLMFILGFACFVLFLMVSTPPPTELPQSVRVVMLAVAGSSILLATLFLGLARLRGAVYKTVPERVFARVRTPARRRSSLELPSNVALRRRR